MPIDTYYQDLEEAKKLGISVSEYQERRMDEKLRVSSFEATESLEAECVALERKEEELRKKVEEQRGLARQLSTMLNERADLESRLQRVRQERAAMESRAKGFIDWGVRNLGNQFLRHSNLVKQATDLAASRAAIPAADEIVAAMQAKLDEQTKKIDDFSRTHGITLQ